MTTMLHKNIVVRHALERGHTDRGWLNSYHMGFNNMQVINEDRIKGGSGFSAHSHRDMEIVSYVVSGGLEHADSMGNKTIILPDEVQIMSAGTGVTHAEMNYLKDQETHFFQIWIIPEKNGLRPGYGQRSFKNELLKQNLVLVVSKDQRNGAIGIHQDADIYIGRLKSKDMVNFNVRAGRHAWIQMIKGSAGINEVNIQAGDGVSISHEKALTISAREGTEFILFDLK